MRKSKVRKSKAAKSKSSKQRGIAIPALKRAIEGRNSKVLAGFYSDGAVLHVIDHDNPPSRPNSIKGRNAIAAYFDDVCGRDMTHKLESAIADKNRVAFTQSCAYPNGTKVFCSTMIELKGGKIAKQTVVQAWDG